MISLSGAAVFDRVVEQVLEQLGELVAVALHIGKIGGQVEPDAHAALAGAQFERVGEVLEQRRQRDPALRRHVLVELDARQRQQVLDQPAHARRLSAHDREKPLARLRRRRAPVRAGSR